MAAEWNFPNSATPVGSPNYYVVRFSPAAQRDALAHWFAWFAHIDKIANKAKDPGVARLKLDWWREEIQLMRKQQARHPLAQMLSQQIQHDWQAEQMQRMLLATEQGIRKLTPENHVAFQQTCRQQGGSRAILLSNTENTSIQTQAQQLGTYCAAVQQLQMLGKHMQQGYFNLPKAYQNKPASDLANLLAPLEKPIQQNWAHMRQQAELATPLRMAAQARQLSRLMQHKNFACREYYFQLSPLRNLWHAWRMQ